MTEANLGNQDNAEIKYKISLLLDIIRRYDTYIMSTNAKASLIIAFNSLIVGAVLLKFNEIVNFHTIHSFRFLTGTLLILLSISSLLSLLFVFKVVYPFFGNIADEKIQQTSLIYFGAVAGMSDQEYFDSFTNASSDQLFSDLSIQATILASGLNKKMLKMRHSINAITFGLVMVLLIILLRAAESVV